MEIEKGKMSLKGVAISNPASEILKSHKEKGADAEGSTWRNSQRSSPTLEESGRRGTQPGSSAKSIATKTQLIWGR